MLMSRKLLCFVYAALAIVALAATWSQNIVFFSGGGNLLAFFEALKTNPPSRSMMADFFLFGLAVTILMVIEGRRVGVKYVWAYIIGGLVIAISVAFPLFLLARELRLEKSDATYLHKSDSILLAILAAGIAAFVFWVELV
jgi:Terpene cyclase DEP1